MSGRSFQHRDADGNGQITLFSESSFDHGLELTVVVYTLVALMQDQVAALRLAGVAYDSHLFRNSGIQ